MDKAGNGGEKMKISTILKTKGNQVHTIESHVPLKGVLRDMLVLRVGSLVVVDGAGKVVGIMTERDLLRNLAKLGAQWENVKVGDVMSRDVILGHPHDTIDDVMALMTERRIRHLPVTDGDTLVGMLSMGDIIKASLTEQAFQNRLLKTYIKNWPEGD
jgi:CBS domain-containing protein